MIDHVVESWKIVDGPLQGRMFKQNALRSAKSLARELVSEKACRGPDLPKIPEHSGGKKGARISVHSHDWCI